MVLLQTTDTAKKASKVPQVIAQESCVYFKGWCAENGVNLNELIDPLVSKERMQTRMNTLCCFYKDPKFIAERLKEVKNTVKKFHGTTIHCYSTLGPRALNETIKLTNIDHILLYDLLKNQWTKKVAGGHALDFYLPNFAKVLKTNDLGKGCKKIDFLLFGRVQEKTIGPWKSFEQTIEKTIESLKSENIIKYKREIRGSKTTITILGKTSENITMETIIDANKNRIKSSYVCAEKMKSFYKLGNK